MFAFDFFLNILLPLLRYSSNIFHIRIFFLFNYAVFSLLLVPSSSYAKWIFYQILSCFHLIFIYSVHATNGGFTFKCFISLYFNFSLFLSILFFNFLRIFRFKYIFFPIYNLSSFGLLLVKFLMKGFRELNILINALYWSLHSSSSCRVFISFLKTFLHFIC